MKSWSDFLGEALAAPGVRVPVLSAELPGDALAIERLLDRAFGPGRFAKVSERVRERLSAPAPHLSRVAREGEAIIGCCRIGLIGLQSPNASDAGEGALGGGPICFLGPLAVDPDRQSAGVGAALVDGALRACAEAGYDAALLVGAPAFFGRLGFTQAPTGSIIFPGPIEAARVMVRALRPGGLPDGLQGLRGRITRPPGANPP